MPSTSRPIVARAIIAADHDAGDADEVIEGLWWARLVEQLGVIALFRSCPGTRAVTWAR
jgi:hypothetical protein